MEVKGYRTPEECFAAYFGLESVEELKEVDSITAIDESGALVSVDEEDLFAGIRTLGIWGWVDDNNTIHYWRGESVDSTTVMHFLGHEIGHLTGTTHEDEYKEELRAEEFGLVASKAFEILTKVIPI